MTGIWKNTIGYDPYAAEGEEAGGQENAFEQAQGLMELVKLSNKGVSENRGLCRKCGLSGHLPFQCRNHLKAQLPTDTIEVSDSDEEDELLVGLGGQEEKGGEDGDISDVSDVSVSSVSDSSDDEARVRSKKKSHNQHSRKRSRSNDEEEEEEEKEPGRGRSEKKRRKKHRRGEDRERRKKSRKKDRKHKKKKDKKKKKKR
eukprot:CAMPEP_0117736524 /NCGR_PEP_ID=MMETSP0947-20121206/1984_1 /TAXON_ID=44440 /ORGANISM="Chattonella subsalsa, Strain CCMP2191" /LENGTH=200 /DNA_ID=CAMNT_0005551837 /DNA_START=234 /DNA_END=837 /DNA_ORIENTATION=+